MLPYFPKPYPDELLYSQIARAKVHLGMSSAKRLLDLLYQKRTVIAVADLPAQLQLLADSLGHLQPVNATKLLYKGTLFPLYAPFIPQQRKMHLTQLMLNGDSSAVYVEIGMSAGKVKMPTLFQYCPLCLLEMRQGYGEYAWLRQWQVPGYLVCTKHQCELCCSSQPFRSIQRHEYFAATPENCLQWLMVPNTDSKLLRLACQIVELLSLPETTSPTCDQWTQLYRQLAAEAGLLQGRQLKIPELLAKFLGYWPTDTLQRLQLPIQGESNWLLSIFRKHRKAFSYMQHLLVWQAFRPDTKVTELIQQANRFPKQAERPVLKTIEKVTNEADRASWLNLLQSGLSVKQARVNDGMALYARLYRNDRDWLLTTNRKLFLPKSNHSAIDWATRDKRYLSVLYQQLSRRDIELDIARQSRNWFLKQLAQAATAEKFLQHLPLCQTFLNRYSESIAEYQIRRLTRQIAYNGTHQKSMQRWELERSCGLAKGRTHRLAVCFMDLLEKDISGANAEKIYQKDPR